MLADTRMPAEWRLETLGNLAHYVNGRAFKPEDWGDTGLPIIRIEQINNPEAECDYFDGVVAPDHVIDDGDLLFSWSATLTTLVWNRGPAALNQHIFKVVPRPRTDRDYLHHLLDFLIEGLAGQAHGSTMQHIKKSDLLPYLVHVPPLPEQRRIAEILDTADRAIGETEALISKLKQMKTGLMHDLLTCGLDERGQLRDPDTHPEQFKDSSLGRIPREWEILSVGALFEMQLGKMLSKAAKTGRNAYPYLANRNVQWDYVDLSDLEWMDFTEAERAKFSLQPGDLLICEGGEIGRTALWRGERQNCYFQKAIHRLRPYDSRILPTYMLRFMRLAVEHGYLINFSSQTSIAHLTREKLALLPIAVPARDEQHRIAEVLDAHEARVRAEEAYRDKLKLHKKGLMDDLLTGRVRLKTAQEVGA